MRSSRVGSGSSTRSTAPRTSSAASRVGEPHRAARGRRPRRRCRQRPRAPPPLVGVGRRGRVGVVRRRRSAPPVRVRGRRPRVVEPGVLLAVGWKDRGIRDQFVDLTDDVWRIRGYGDFFSYCLLAEGTLEIAAETEVSLWDLAPLDLLVREAGGRFTSLEGSDGPHGGSAVATNGLLHDEVLPAPAALIRSAHHPAFLRTLSRSEIRVRQNAIVRAEGMGVTDESTKERSGEPQASGQGTRSGAIRLGTRHHRHRTARHADDRLRKLARAAGANPPSTRETWTVAAQLIDEKDHWAGQHPDDPRAARDHADEKIMWVKPPIVPWS